MQKIPVKGGIFQFHIPLRKTTCQRIALTQLADKQYVTDRKMQNATSDQRRPQNLIAQKMSGQIS